MAQGMQLLRSRIRSTEGTMKITSAMELLANAKLQKLRGQMVKNKEFSSVLQETLGHVLAASSGISSPYLNKKEDGHRLTIVFSSDLGLCGGYNNNMLKHALSIMKRDDPVMVIGSRLRGAFEQHGYKVINPYIDSDAIAYNQVSQLINYALDMYLNDNIDGIQVVYTRLVNTITFEPSYDILLPVPLKYDYNGEAAQEVLFEPGPEEILNLLVPMALKSSLYSRWLETKTSEQASRRASMESATDNGNELKEKLTLQYNGARQASITQEITEIVGGAEAL